MESFHGGKRLSLSLGQGPGSGARLPSMEQFSIQLREEESWDILRTDIRDFSSGVRLGAVAVELNRLCSNGDSPCTKRWTLPTAGSRRHAARVAMTDVRWEKRLGVKLGMILN